MMTVDPIVLGGVFVGLVTLQLAWLGILVAVICFYYRRLDRRLQGIVEPTYEPPADPAAAGSR